MRAIAVMFLLPHLCMASEIIDRVAVSIGSQVVTKSMIRRMIRLQAFVENTPVVYSVENMKQAAERLIDQSLVRREIEITRYSPLPQREAEKQIEVFLKRRNMSQEQYRTNLAKYDFSEEDLRDEFLWQITVMQFVEFRFSPSVQVSEAEVREYYTKTYVPKFASTTPGTEPPPMEDVYERISAIIASTKSNSLLFQWLQQGREQAKVRYVEEAFQ